MVCPWGGGYEQAAFENYMGKNSTLPFTLHYELHGAEAELNAMPYGQAKHMAIRKVELMEVA